MNLQTTNFLKAKDDFFYKEPDITAYEELVLFLSFLKQVGLAPAEKSKNWIVKSIKDEKILSLGAKKLFSDLFIIQKLEKFILDNHLKLDIKTRYFQQTINDILITSVDFNNIEDIFIKNNTEINLEPVLNNLIISFLRNYEKTNEEKSAKQKTIIYQVLDKYKSLTSKFELENFLEAICLKVRMEMKGKEGKRNKTKETLDIVHNLNPDFLEQRTDVFISHSAIVYTKAHLAALLDTSFSNNKEALYKLLWNYLSRNLSYNSQISLVMSKLKAEPDFLEQLKLFTPNKCTVNKNTMIEIEKEILSHQIIDGTSSNKKKLKI